MYTMKHKPICMKTLRRHTMTWTDSWAPDCAPWASPQPRGQDVGAPTVNVATLRACLSLIPVKGWHFETIDISRAYLQSNNLERPVYIIPPTTVEADQSVVWKALKPVYGLCDSTKNWALTMQEALQEMGGVQSIADPSMHYFSGWGKKQWYERNPPHKLEQLEPLSWELPPETIGHLQDVEVFGFCVIHVDDVLYAGNNKFLNYFRSSMMNRFICKQPDRDSACYLGMQIDRLENGDLEVGSNGYEDQIEPNR